jgi:predicted transcriptional regulator
MFKIKSRQRRIEKLMTEKYDLATEVDRLTKENNEYADCLKVNSKLCRQLSDRIEVLRNTGGRFTSDKRPQTVQVMEYMNAHGSISQFEATIKLKVCCLAERIRDLKENGVLISDEWISKNGKRYKAYSIKK